MTPSPDPLLPTTLRLDAGAIRVLAHPLRSRLLTALRTDGPATATALAHALATNTGATSYHLRRLASVGLVEETDEGRGRERWWRAASTAHAWRARDVEGDPDARAASEWLEHHYLAWFTERYEAWLEAQGRVAPRLARGRRDERCARPRHRGSAVGAAGGAARGRGALPGRGSRRVRPAGHRRAARVPHGPDPVTTELDPRTARRRYLLLTALRWLPTGFTIPIYVLLPLSRGLSLTEIGLVFSVQGLVVLALELPDRRSLQFPGPTTGAHPRERRRAGLARRPHRGGHRRCCSSCRSSCRGSIGRSTVGRSKRGSWTRRWPPIPTRGSRAASARARPP